MTSTFGQLPFQNKQKKAELLGTYGNYFEEFKLQLPMSSRFQLPPSQLDFRNTSSWEITKSEEKEEKEAKNQKFTYQKPISENLDIETPNFQMHLANKPQDFNAFKLAFLQYFSNNNSINQLANTFTTIKQGENEAVTTYLGCFYKNLHQIQTIQTDYFTVPQILNQFIKGLHSSILQCICPIHPVDLQAAVTNTRDFKAAKLEANHAQAINLVMNELSELDSKLKQFSDSINQKLEGYLIDNQAIYQPPQ
ncbi:hypothetical protein G9A89_023649 [Geosiphon pyriformis]|nr:hypothetical protein G9A89_023649 [Geosiphon pyriformis]